MKFSNLLLLCILCIGGIKGGYSQSPKLINKEALLFTLESEEDTIDFTIIDTTLDKKKPIFLWCQGSLPVPLFAEIEGYGLYMIAGGIKNFDYKKIVEQYHLVVISMPKTPAVGGKDHLNDQFQYIPNKNYPASFSSAFLRADYLENYVKRGLHVLQFLSTQNWIDNASLVVAGHSQGAKVAAKLALKQPRATNLGLFAPNPFGRIDEKVRMARWQAETGALSWEQADSSINQLYTFFEQATMEKNWDEHPEWRAWDSFSETFYKDWLQLDIPIYLAYGTADRSAELCDIIPFFFHKAAKTNLRFKRYLYLEHNFFEVEKNGMINYEKSHWIRVMNDFLNTLKPWNQSKK